MTIGIYKITNNINNKIYIGQSNNIEKRFTQHKSPTAKEHFPNMPLYDAIEKYGINNFTFEIIEECSLDKLNIKEQYWIQFYNSLVEQNGYNVRGGGQTHCENDHPKRKLCADDVKDIRTRYANHERCKEVEALYSDRIGHSGFSKIWKGETWPSIMPEVYTQENIEFHKHNTGQKGSSNGRSLLDEEDVYNIRLRKKTNEDIHYVYEDYKYTGIKFNSFQNVWNNRNWKHIVVE